MPSTSIGRTPGQLRQHPGELRRGHLERLAPHVLLGDQITRQEAFGEQQQINIRGVRRPGEVQDGTCRRVHVAEDLPRRARTDPHHANLRPTPAGHVLPVAPCG
jgi:hypothetical protein